MATRLTRPAAFGWGPVAASAGTAEIVVVVDVLRFTTAVTAAAAAGIAVRPCPWARGPDADPGTGTGTHPETSARAESGSDPAGASGPPGTPSLSPLSFAGGRPGQVVDLASPNGATCALAAAAAGATVVAGCLRNAGAVARWVAGRLADARPGTTRARPEGVAVIACGERWPDGSLRPALEDLIGAGAVLARLPLIRTPDAEAAVAAFERIAARLAGDLSRTPSARELADTGRADDVAYSCRLDTDVAVPVLRDGAFRPAGAG